MNTRVTVTQSRSWQLTTDSIRVTLSVYSVAFPLLTGAYYASHLTVCMKLHTLTLKIMVKGKTFGLLPHVMFLGLNLSTVSWLLVNVETKSLVI